jgi:RimJ/RimL family protein N-acetyltransferase
MRIVLETPRLVLRQFTEADAENLFALDSDPEVMRHTGPNRLPDADAYRQLIRDRFLPYYARYESYGFWAVVEKVSGAWLGWFHLRPALDYRFAAEAGYREGDVDLGYRFVRAAWGKGYATEGARALVRKALTELDAARVVSCALEGNAASTRVMEKVGLKFAGRFAMPGYEQPAVLYVLRREEFDPSAWGGGD